MKVKGIALFSGGLDSILAVKVILEQGIEVLGVTFETPFFSSKNARAAAKKIELPLVSIDITEDHVRMVRAPRYGYGRNMNPCIDCHTLMLKKAGGIMKDSEADFIFTGEVLGQRPMSQSKQSLHIVAKNSGYQEYIIRPLSGKLLPETKPEIEGKVDRRRLLAIRGKGRKHQIELARHYGITDYANPAGGCLLTDPGFSNRLRDLFKYHSDFGMRDIELLKYGRHFRIDETSKVIVGRNSFDNESLLNFAEDCDTVIRMARFPGPVALVPYGGGKETLMYAAALCALYSDAPNDSTVVAVCRSGVVVQHIQTKAAEKEDAGSRII